MRSKYYVIAPSEFGGIEVFETEQRAKEYAEDILNEMRYDAAEGWNEEVEFVEWGILIPRQATEIVKHPGYCDYKLVDVGTDS